jgi:hypothetical protein
MDGNLNRPIQLIKFKGSTFELNEEAMNILKSNNDEIIVVSIVGKARTGKSFLMNSLLDLGVNKGVRLFFMIFIFSSKLALLLTHVLKEFGYGEILKISLILMQRYFLLTLKELVALIEALRHTTRKFSL